MLNALQSYINDFNRNFTNVNVPFCYQHCSKNNHNFQRDNFCSKILCILTTVVGSEELMASKAEDIPLLYSVYY